VGFNVSNVPLLGIAAKACAYVSDLCEYLALSEPNRRFSDNHRSVAAIKTLNFSRSASLEYGSGCDIFTPVQERTLSRGQDLRSSPKHLNHEPDSLSQTVKLMSRICLIRSWRWCP